ILFSSLFGSHRLLPSFPTRRSSDLKSRHAFLQSCFLSSKTAIRLERRQSRLHIPNEYHSYLSTILSVHQNIASYVLRCSKFILCLKTTCSANWRRAFKTPSEVGVLLNIKMDFIMNGKEKKEQNKGGHKPKANPSIHRYSISLNDMENTQFLTLFEQSGMKVMAHFITACIFQKPIKTVKIDMDAVDFHTRLTNFYS